MPPVAVSSLASPPPSPPRSVAAAATTIAAAPAAATDSVTSTPPSGGRRGRGKVHFLHHHSLGGAGGGARVRWGAGDVQVATQVATAAKWCVPLIPAAMGGLFITPHTVHHHVTPPFHPPTLQLPVAH